MFGLVLGKKHGMQTISREKAALAAAYFAQLLPFGRLDGRHDLLLDSGGSSTVYDRLSIGIEFRRIQVAMAIGQHCVITDSMGPNQ